MIVSSIKRSLRVGVVVAAGVLWGLAFWATDGAHAMSAARKPEPSHTDAPPVPLVPPSPSDAPAAPTYMQSEYQEPVNGPAIPADSPISVLGSAEGNTVGLLGGASDLGDDIWAATPRGTVVGLLQKGALATTDPAVRDMAKRILLTKADAPNGEAKTALITVRIGQLIGGGLLDEAGTLAARSALPDDAEFARVQAEALLYAGRSEDVCSDLTATRFASGDLFWIELRAYCAVASGDSILGELTIAALDAQGGDPAFKTLLDDVAWQKNAMPQVFTNPNALQLFLLRKLDLPVPSIFAANGGIPENLAILSDKRIAADIRLQAAESVVRNGAAPMAILREVTAARTLSMTEISNAEVLAPNMPFFAAQSLLRRALEVEIHPDRKEKLIGLALDLAAKQNRLAFAAAYFGDFLASLVPVSPDNPGLFARAMLLNDNERNAARWLAWDRGLHVAAKLLSSDKAGEGSLQMTLSQIYDSLTGPQGKPDSYMALIVGMAATLGRLNLEVADLSSGPYVAAYVGKRPDTATMAQLASAAATPGRKGEALLLILNQVQAIGWADMAPDASIKFVRYLRTMGYGPAAQSFAREALLLYAPRALQTQTAAPSAPVK